MTTESSHVARLLAVPAQLFLESQNHQHDLLRELTLMDVGSRFEVTDVELPHRLATFISDILHDYSGVRLTTRRQALEALAGGRETVDLTVPVTPDLVPALRRWLELVEQADEFCSSGALLTLAASPAIRDLRRWYVDAVAACADAGDGESAAVAFGSPPGRA